MSLDELIGTEEDQSLLLGTFTEKGLPVAVAQHREEFRRYVLQEAKSWHREHLGRLYGHWDEWNERHFEGRMFPPYLLLNEPTAPRVYGCCASISGFGGVSEIRIRPSLLLGTHPHMRGGPAYAEGRFLFVADVLLHEMIHQWQQEVTHEYEESYHGHGPHFRDLCNAIGAVLGLARVRDMKKRGPDKDLPSCAHWPHNVRPRKHYQGAYIAVFDSGEAEARRRMIEAVDLYDQILQSEERGDRETTADLVKGAQARIDAAARFWGRCRRKLRQQRAAQGDEEAAEEVEI